MTARSCGTKDVTRPVSLDGQLILFCPSVQFRSFLAQIKICRDRLPRTRFAKRRRLRCRRYRSPSPATTVPVRRPVRIPALVQSGSVSSLPAPAPARSRWQIPCYLYLLYFLPFALLPLFFVPASFVFNRLRTLLRKHRGWHTPPRSSRVTGHEPQVTSLPRFSRVTSHKPPVRSR